MNSNTILKEEAYALAVAVEAGLASVDVAISWADRLIAVAPRIPGVLLAVSMPQNGHPQDVVRPLKELAAGVEPGRAVRRVIALMRERFITDPEAYPKLTADLERLALQGIVPNEQAASQMARLDDARLLAEAGTYGSPADILHEFSVFLENESAPDFLSVDASADYEAVREFLADF